MSYRYPHPGNEKEFEQFCLKLLIRHWSNPSLELYGKRGERQFGVDIIDLGYSSPFKAAQCKHHEPEKTLPPADIRDEVEKAKGFTPPLDHYAILTTGRITTQAHNEVIRINQEHAATGLFKVELFSWEKIERLLDQYPEVKDELLSVTNSQLVEIDRKLSTIQAAQAVVLGATSTDLIDMEIDEALSFLTSHDHQMAKLHLQKIKRRKWDSLSAQQKYRVDAALANVLHSEGKLADAARLLLEAKNHQPDTERAQVNEALAYEFLGDRQRAYTLAADLLKAYPISSKLTAALIRNAPPSLTLEDLEDRVPLAAAEDAEVCVALAMKAMDQSLFDRAEEFARRGIDAKDDWIAPHFLLGQACLAGQLTRADREYWVSRPTVDRSKIQEAIAAFDRAIELGGDQQRPHETVEPLLRRAVAKALLGNEDGADEDFGEAVRIAPDEPGVLYRYAAHLHDRGDIAGAIRALRKVLSLNAGMDVQYHLARALRERNEGDDRREATNLFINMASLQALSPEQSLNRLSPESLSLLREEAFHASIEGLIEESRLDELSGFLDSVSDGRFSGVATATARSKQSLAAGDRAKALTAADESLAGITDRTSRNDLRALAIQLVRLERHKDALPLWEKLNEPGEMSGDVYHLIKCADRVNRHDVILKVCKRLRESGIDDPWLLHRELDILEVYDIDQAIAVLQEYLASHPADRVSRIRLSGIGLHRERADLVDARPEAIPDLDTVTPNTGALAVQVLRKSGRATEAMHYAYELFRRNFDDPVANQALFMAVLAPDSAQPNIHHPAAVEPGCAVCYSEEGRTDTWIIIEDSPNPNRAIGEYPPEDPFAEELKGKRIGESFLLGKSTARDRMGVIKDILSKYVYRMRYIADSWQVRFRDIPWMQVFQTTRRNPATGQVEFDPTDIMLVADNQFQQRKTAEETYKTSLIPIHVFAHLLGCKDYDASIIAALLAGLEVRCCEGTPEERVQAMDSFEGCTAIVLHLSAIATLSLFREERILERWDGKLIISQDTAQELRSLLDDARRNAPPHSRFGKTERGYHFIPVDAEAEKLEQDGLSTWIDVVLGKCEIRGCQELASMDPDKREELTNVLGQHGVESMILGSLPGNVLWADDLALAKVAAGEFGTRHGWTQVAVEYGCRRGYFDEQTYATVSAKLLGFDYRSTMFNQAVVIRAGVLTDWNPDKWPFKQTLEQVANESLDAGNACGLAAATIAGVYRQAVLAMTRHSVLIRIAEKLACRKEGLDLVQALITVLPQLFGLNVLGLEEARGVLIAWLTEAVRRPSFRM